PETRVEVDRSTGIARHRDGRPVRAGYVLSDGSFTPDGEVVARDPRAGVALYRTDGVVRTSTLVRGLYPRDTWSGPRVVYRRLACAGGSLAVTLASDANLFARPQTIVARVGGRVAARLSLDPIATRTLRVPLRPDARGECRVVFTVSPTAVPGPDDPRVLGAHFLGFA